MIGLVVLAVNFISLGGDDADSLLIRRILMDQDRRTLATAENRCPAHVLLTAIALASGVLRLA